MADILASLLQGYQGGAAMRQDSERRTLADLLGKARGATGGERDALMSQAYPLGPDTAMQAEQSFGQLDDAKRQRLGQTAAVFSRMPPEMRAQLWPQVREQVASILPGEYPEQWDESLLPVAEGLAQQFGGASAAEQYTLAPGAARYDASGNLVAERPFAPTRDDWTVTSVPDGRGGQVQMEYNSATGEWRQPSYTGGSAPQSGGGRMVMDDAMTNAGGPMPQQGGDMFAFLGNIPGVEVTSGQRTPEHNAKVGGVPNSYHLSGQARDIAPPQTREQADAIRREAAANGLEVIDEGDHWHLEPRGGGNASRLGYTPPQGVRTLSADEVARMGLRPGTVAQVDAQGNMKVVQAPPAESAGGRLSATQLRQVNAAKQKMTDLRAVRQQLDRVREKFGPLKDSWSAGGVFGIGGNLIPSESGERFDAAVDMLRTHVRKLTRTPGEGAMSDWEGRLANLANPSRGDKEAVTQDKIAQLYGLLDTLEQGYEAILQDNSLGAGPAAESGGLSPEEQAELDQLRAHFGRK